MSRPIKTIEQAMMSAVKIIEAQDKLLAAYRTGRTPGGAIDTLNYERPRLDEWLRHEGEQR